MLKPISILMFFLFFVNIAIAFNYSSGSYEGELTVLDSAGNNISSGSYETIIALGQLDYPSITSGTYETQLGVLHQYLYDFFPVPIIANPSNPVSSPPSNNLITPPSSTNLTDLFGKEPNEDGTCPEKYQYLDGRCYPCDPERGYLDFNPADRSVVCILCAEGSVLNGTTCIAGLNKREKLFNILDTSVLDLAGKLKITIALAYVITLILICTAGYYGWIWLKKKEKKEDDKEENP